MKFTLTIECDNDGFFPFVSQADGGVPVGEGSELERLVRKVADQVAEGADHFGALKGIGANVIDVNGNTVGSWSVR